MSEVATSPEASTSPAAAETSPKFDNTGKIFVGNLSSEITSDEISAFFKANSSLGAPKEIQLFNTKELQEKQVAEGKHIHPRRKNAPAYAFVVFENDEIAQSASEFANEKELKGTTITSKKAETREKNPRFARPRGRVLKKSTKSKSKSPSKGKEETTEGKKTKSKKSNEPAGETDPVPSDGDGEVVKNKRKPKVARKPRRERSEGTESESVIYIANLPFSLTDEALLEAFKEYEPVKASVIRNNFNKRSKGFGFVDFGTKDKQTVVVEKLVGNFEIEGRKALIRIAVEYPEDKKEETTESA